MQNGYVLLMVQKIELIESNHILRCYVIFLQGTYALGFGIHTFRYPNLMSASLGDIFGLDLSPSSSTWFIIKLNIKSFGRFTQKVVVLMCPFILKLEGNQNTNNCLVSNFYNKFEFLALFSVRTRRKKSARNFNLF